MANFARDSKAWFFLFHPKKIVVCFVPYLRIFFLEFFFPAEVFLKNESLRVFYFINGRIFCSDRSYMYCKLFVVTVFFNLSSHFF